MEREDPRDCFVSSRFGSLADLPAGARVGTSSLRRELMLRIRYPQLTVLPVRGNVNTRLAKLDRGEFDALIMASAGLKRLGFADRIRQILPTTEFLPAPGQGALGIEVTSASTLAASVVAPLEHADTRAITAAERAVSRGLGGSCQVPLAAHAQIEGGQMHLRALVGNHKTAQHVVVERRGVVADGEAMALDAVAELKARGALQLLAA
jgi:hydroxymethylbilane synthase